jgi:hypothetical protein
MASVSIVPGSSWERDVHVVACARTDSVFVSFAGLGMGLRTPGAVVVVEADDQHVIAVVEHLLCLVAVMDFPVENWDLLNRWRFEGSFGGDCGVVEKAEAVGLCGLGVVPAWAHECVRDRRALVFDGMLSSRNCCPCGVPCGGEASFVCASGRCESPATTVAECLERIHVFGGVNPFECSPARWRHLCSASVLSEFVVDTVSDVPNPFVAVRVWLLDGKPTAPLGLELACRWFVFEERSVPKHSDAVSHSCLGQLSPA